MSTTTAAPASAPPATAEHARLAEATGRAEDDLFTANPWYEWGPYLSERAWGTVREDYSADGDAWDYFPHDHARSRAYRWNEDGMAGHLATSATSCAWRSRSGTARDPILKERMFGLTGPEGNHGEDAKEYWWYLDGPAEPRLAALALPLPAGAFPYDDLVAENGRRGRDEPEYELLDTGVFDDDRYWIVEVDLRQGIADRGPGPDRRREPRPGRGDARTSCRRSGSATPGRGTPAPSVPDARTATATRVAVRPPASRRLPARGRARPRRRRARGAVLRQRDERRPALRRATRRTPYPKDGINDHVVAGARDREPGAARARRPRCWYRVTVPGGRHGRAAAAAAPPGRRSDPQAPPAWAAAAFDEMIVDPRARGRRVLRRARAGRAPTPSDAGAAPGVRRADLEQAVLPLRRRALARRRSRRSRRRPPGHRPAATRAGGTSTPSTSCRCPTRGSTRGSRPGTSPSTPSPGRTSIPAFAKYQLIVLLPRVVPAPERRPSRLRVELRRRQPAGARPGRAAGVRHRRRHATSTSWSGSSRSCSSTSPGG